MVIVAGVACFIPMIDIGCIGGIGCNGVGFGIGGYCEVYIMKLFGFSFAHWTWRHG